MARQSRAIRNAFSDFGFAKTEKGKTGNYFEILKTRDSNDSVAFQIIWQCHFVSPFLAPSPQHSDEVFRKMNAEMRVPQPEARTV